MKQLQRMRLRVIFVGLLALLLIISGCSQQNDPPTSLEKPPTEDPQSQAPTESESDKNALAPTVGGNISVALLGLPSWNPLKWGENDAHYSTAERLVYRGLFTYNEQEELVGDFIKEYTVEENEDETVLTFTLKDNLFWHDGTPISFDDVQFTLETYLNPFYYGAWKQNLSYINGTSQYRSGRRDHISGINQLESGEITLSLSAPTSSFYHALTAPLLPAHKLADMHPEEIATLGEEGNLLGNGPFKLKAKTDSVIELERGFAHQDGGPYIDALTFSLSTGKMDGRTETGAEVIAILPMAGMSSQNDSKADENGEQQTIEVVQNLFYYLGFNHEQEQLKQVELKRAITMAIDYQSIIDQLLFGHGVVPPMLYSPSSWLNNDIKANLSEQLEEAKGLMNRLGYSEEKPLQLKIHYNGSQKLIDELVTMISTNLQEIYVKLEPVALEREAYFAYLFSGQPVELFIHSWPFSKDIGYWWKLYGAYHSVNDLGLNILRYHDQEAEILLKDLYYSKPDHTQREQVQKVVKQFNNDAIFVPLFSPTQTYFIGSNLHGVKMNGDGWLLDIENWWLEK